MDTHYVFVGVAVAGAQSNLNPQAFLPAVSATDGCQLSNSELRCAYSRTSDVGGGRKAPSSQGSTAEMVRSWLPAQYLGLGARRRRVPTFVRNTGGCIPPV